MCSSKCVHVKPKSGGVLRPQRAAVRRVGPGMGGGALRGGALRGGGFEHCQALSGDLSLAFTPCRFAQVGLV